MRIIKPMAPAPTIYQDVKDMAEEYHKMINDASAALSTNPTNPQLNIANEPVGFYISKNEMAAISGFANITGFDKYIVLFGIEKTSGFLSAIIMGADASGNILTEHKTATITKPEVPQETWPDKVQVRLSEDIQLLKDFMQ